MHNIALYITFLVCPCSKKFHYVTLKWVSFVSCPICSITIFHALALLIDEKAPQAIYLQSGLQLSPQLLPTLQRSTTEIRLYYNKNVVIWILLLQIVVYSWYLHFWASSISINTGEPSLIPSPDYKIVVDRLIVLKSNYTALKKTKSVIFAQCQFS